MSCSLVIKDSVYKAKAKTFSQGQDLVIQGQGQDLYEVFSSILEPRPGLEDNKTGVKLIVNACSSALSAAVNGGAQVYTSLQRSLIISCYFFFH